MDPQHRLLLESCWHAIEDAGYNVDAIDVPVGVILHRTTRLTVQKDFDPRTPSRKVKSAPK